MEDTDILDDQPQPASDLAQKCEEYLAGWKRAQADYANIKKDHEREKQEYSKYANERLLSELLPAVDQFEIALNFTPDTAQLPEEQRKKFDNWLVGVKAVRGLWENAFQQIGLEKVKTDGQFDPLLHEAVGQEAQADHTDGTIVRVMQSGWSLSGKLLRPAKVIVTQN